MAEEIQNELEESLDLPKTREEREELRRKISEEKDRLKVAVEDWKWVKENYAQMQERYPRKHLMVSHKHVVVVANNRRELLNRAYRFMLPDDFDGMLAVYAREPVQAQEQR